MNKRVILLITMILSIFSVYADTIQSGDTKTFKIQFTKNGIIDFGFRNNERVVFPSVSDAETTAEFDFYYINTATNPGTLNIIFDSSDIYDYLDVDTNYMLYNSEENAGLNYAVSIDGIERIPVSNSAEAMKETLRTLEIEPTKSTDIQYHTVTMTLNPPGVGDAPRTYTAGRYEGFILLVYRPAE